MKVIEHSQECKRSSSNNLKPLKLKLRWGSWERHLITF